MLRHALVGLAFCCGSAATVFAGDQLNDVRKSFTIGGKPVPPEIFADYGDAMMSDSRPIVVTVWRTPGPISGTGAGGSARPAPALNTISLVIAVSP